MIKKVRIISIITVVSIALSLLVACNNWELPNTVPYDKKADESIMSSTVASNSNYELLWEDDVKCVMLKDIATGKIWSTIPYDYYLAMGASANVNSTLNIIVSNSQTLKWDNVNGYSEAYLDGRITCSKIKNGLKVTYYFDKYKISIPIVYRLREDSIEISIDPSEISESEEYLLVAVSPAPFLCSTANSGEDSYLFIPTGSGALMYTDERAEGDRLYSCELYGVDGSRLFTKPEIDKEPIRMPVYGVRDKENALFGIIESGAESAVLDATAGNSRTGYSNVYTSFYLRSYDKVSSGIQALNYADITKISENLSATPIKLAYYPLYGENADYMGMVNCYRKYLSDTGMIKDGYHADNTYGVNIIGGVLTSSTVLGMPGEKLDVMTTFSQATEMVKKLTEISDMKPEIILTGFGDSGIIPGKIAGGFDLSSIFGDERYRMELEQYCLKNGLSLFTDFDVVRYRSSSIGFNYIFDAAKSASLQAVEKSLIKIPLNQYDERIEYRLIKRAKLQKAIDKLVSSAKKLKISGVSLSTLGSIAYSDYSNSTYYSKGNMADDVIKYIKQVQDAGHKVAVNDANIYAAAIGDVVFDAPVNNGNYFVFDDSIPFYEMVFLGSKPIYSSAINTSADIQKQIMLSLTGGARLSFALIHDFCTADLDFQTERLYSAVFGSNLAIIEETLKKYEPFYSAIAGSRIENYEIFDNGISKTVFDNGVILYANHSVKTVVSPVGELGPYSVNWSKE